jgi:ATP-binding cassette subfamily C protein LapB
VDFRRNSEAEAIGDSVEYPGTPEVPPVQEEDAACQDDVTLCLAFLARLNERPSSPVIIRAGLALDERGNLPFHQVESALDQLGLRGELYSGKLTGLRPKRLPAILKLQGGRAAVLLEVRDGETLLYRPGEAEPFWTDAGALALDYAGEAVCVEPDPTKEREGERPWQRAVRSHWFWGEVWKVRRAFNYVALAAVIINLLALAVPLFTMNVYDRIIPNKSAVSLWVLAIGVLLALGLEFSLRLARARLIDDLGRSVDARLSQRLFAKTMNVPLASRQGSTGALARRVADYETVREFFASTTVVLIIDIFFLFIFLVIIALLAGWLVFVPITGIVLMAIAGTLLQKSMGRSAIDAQADASLQHSVLVESIAGQETLKATGAEGRMLGRWRRYADMNALTQERLRGLTAISINLASLCQQMMSVGLIIGGFYLFNAGSISMGAIIAIVMLSGRAMAPVGQFAFLMTRAKHAFTIMDSLQSLSEMPDERFTGRSLLPTIARGEIRFDHVSFRYPEAAKDSLADLSLTIRPGERIAVIGRVASGKSTLGRILCGLYAPTEGSYLVDGIDSRQHHPHQLRQAFRYVGQDAELFRGTIRDNLALASADPSDERLLAAIRRSGADQFLSQDAAGFDLFVGERGASLSGGQRSFLVLARALVEPCQLLYLDEPTGAMDTQTEQLFIEKLGLAIGPDQTLVVSTHRNAMLKLVDRLIVLDQGRVIADGPKDSVLGALAALQEGPS